MSRLVLSTKLVEPLIFTIRGQRVIIDRDLAQIYGVKAKRLNEQVNEIEKDSRKIFYSSSPSTKQKSGFFQGRNLRP